MLFCVINNVTLPVWQGGLGAHTQGFPPGLVSGVCHTAPGTESGPGRPHRSLPDLTAAGSPACPPDSGPTHCYRQGTTPETERGYAYSVEEIGRGEDKVIRQFEKLTHRRGIKGNIRGIFIKETM